MCKRIFLILAIAAAAGTAAGVDFSPKAVTGRQPGSTVFASAFQRFARLKNHDNDLNTRYNPTVGAIGYVYSGQNFDVGASFSYEHGTRKYTFDDGSMKVRSNTPGFALFGTAYLNDGWYVDGSTYLGFNRLKARDFNEGGTWYGDSGTKTRTQFAASIEVGKSFLLDNNWSITPHIGLDYARSPKETYHFTGSNQISLKSENFWEIPLGVGVSRTFLCGNWAVTPFADATLVAAIGHTDKDSMNAYPGFSYRTAHEWKTTGIAGDHWGGRIRTGVNAKVNERTSLGLDYTFEGRSGYRDHRLTASLGWSF